MEDSRKFKSYSNVEATDIIHQVANLYISTKTPKDYGTGDTYTSVEVHLLKRIIDVPGITVTELAVESAKTKGAISQMLKKIEGKGLIRREHSSDNENKCYLYATEKGRKLDQAHRRYDEVNSAETINQVRKLFTEEEMNIAFSVLEAWLFTRRQVHQKRLKQKQLVARKKT